MKPDTVVIKKYGNRRLYDTSSSRYINLEEIAALIRNGTEVQVVDVNTGEDLTRVTLTQIIVENAKDQPTGLPLELLRQLVVASDHVGQEFLSWYLKSAFDAYQKVQGAIQGGLSEVAAFSPLSMMKNLVQASSARPQSSESELDQLRTRIAELEARVPVGATTNGAEDKVNDLARQNAASGTQKKTRKKAAKNAAKTSRGKSSR